MSTQLKRVANGYEVSTVIAPGKRRKMARRSVFVGNSDLQRVKEEIVRQAKAARAELGLKPEKEVPTV